MDMNQHIANLNTDKPFHSNGYARVAVGNRVGATASQISFEQRRQIDTNRRLVYGYNRSALGNSYAVSRTKPVITDFRHQNIVPTNSVPQRYNPYA